MAIITSVLKTIITLGAVQGIIAGGCFSGEKEQKG
jgi:hypothetical protein